MSLNDVLQQLPSDISDSERLKVIAAFQALESIIAILDQHDVQLSVEHRPHILSFEDEAS
jgi:hypothetical protein